MRTHTEFNQRPREKKKKRTRGGKQPSLQNVAFSPCLHGANLGEASLPGHGFNVMDAASLVPITLEGFMRNGKGSLSLA